MSDLVPANETTADELALLQELGTVGLEDVDQADLTLPWMKIRHPRQLFVHPHTNEEFEELEVILLGVVKQRSLFPPELEGDGGAPLCKSFDHDEGFPTNVEEFPWDASGFERPEDGANVSLSCDDCRLKEFGTNPKNPKAPWCSERHVYPTLIMDPETGAYVPVLLAAQKTSIRPSKNYLSWFVTNKRPMFTVVTLLSLDAERRGTNEYSIIRFERLGNSDSSKWTYWADQFTKTKDMLTTPFFRDTQASTEQPVATPARAPRQPKQAAPQKNDLWDE